MLTSAATSPTVLPGLGASTTRARVLMETAERGVPSHRRGQV